MPRANRHFLPSLIWHLAHCCHERSFLLKFSRDRTTHLRWLYEAPKRFGLCVLNYMVTSNHIHLLVKKMRAEYDFDYSKAVRGKYYKRILKEGANIVVLEPDIAKAFPDSAAVNDALRVILKASRSAKRLTTGSTATGNLIR
ncbi:MAG TPA: hypothetical protein VFB20_04640 [Burkholderiales bacterium]|nr:hypothetical protein [Burkholderiales bacterium]